MSKDIDSQFVTIHRKEGIASITLKRGKVNALNQVVVDDLYNAFNVLELEQNINAIILTGQGSFFSFGFDIPEFLSFTKQEFTSYLTSFTGLYARIFSYPKPVVAALNGHTIAGGCMLALACDHRAMITGKARISLNEIDFGASVFAGCMEMLRYWIGEKNSARVLYSGNMYTAEEANVIGLVDEVTTTEELDPCAIRIARELGAKHQPAFASIKLQLRKLAIDEIKRLEPDSIKEFADIWYSSDTWENLQNIKIY